MTRSAHIFTSVMFETLLYVHVHILISVKILGSVTSPLRRALLHYAVRRKQAELSSGVVRNNSLWDKLVFNRIQVSF